jgi:hypothetical protein
MAVSPSRKVLYVGGDFTRIGGVKRAGIAALSVATGKVLTSFRTTAVGQVRALVATARALYLGGNFSAVNGVVRHKLAAVVPTTGALTTWAPAVGGGRVLAMVPTPDGSRLVVAGNMKKLAGRSVWGVGAVSAVTGRPAVWLMNRRLQDWGRGAATDTLATDGVSIFGGGYAARGPSTGKYEGAWSADPDDGSLTWMEDCHGDTYGVFPLHGYLYVAGHPHYCGNVGGWAEQTPRVEKRLMAWTATPAGTIRANPGRAGYAKTAGLPAPAMVDWFPDMTVGSYTAAKQAVWDLTGTGRYLLAGGEFTRVNGTLQQGLARFALRGTPGNPGTQGPRVSGASLVPTLQPSASSVAVSFPADWDRDDLDLTYTVTRRDATSTTVVHTGSVASTWWRRPAVRFVDTGLAPDTTYQYRIVVSDPHGNRVPGDWTPVTTPPSPDGSTAPQQ